ncbi:MAG: CIA30 family protein [Marinicellaceae bacterium]
MIFLTLIIAMNTNMQPISFNLSQFSKNQMMIVNDSVMGGRSSSQFQLQETVVNFNGTVSLQNNGGFASLRMLWPFDSAQGYNKIVLKLKGDGKSYQFRLRTSRGFDGAAYSYEFDTIKDEMMSIEIGVAQFIPGFRGRVLRNMPDLALEDVQQMGFLIADKQVGKFEIDLHSITLFSL